MKNPVFLASGAILVSGLPALAQNPVSSTVPIPTAAPAKPSPTVSSLGSIGGFNLSGNLRSRAEYFDWFDAPGYNDSYFFTGNLLRLSGLRSTKGTDIQLDVQGTLLTGVPDDAIAPAPQGALGLGGNYRAANGSQEGAVSIKQAFVRFKNVSGPGSALRVGRFEFADGSEIATKDPTLNWLKTQRISQRLIGPFGFSHVGRAFDGAQYSTPLGKHGTNFTAVGARPTEGVFKLDANDNIDGVDFLYAALSKGSKHSDARFFGLLYEDKRDAATALKTDNRPLAARQADNEDIRVYTIGANYTRVFDTKHGKVDALAWGALQGGDWGALDQKANALALEAGYQPKGMKLKPWFRLGYFRSSGDDNKTDGDHNTFFAPLPTPRIYARFPFFNSMNSTDLFGQAILRPNPKTNLRFEAHSLKLTEGNDLWYSGGGAFNDNGSGITGRPSGGDKSLATLLDFSLDYTINPKSSVGFYYGYAMGHDVIENIYPSGKNASYAFLEYSRKF